MEKLFKKRIFITGISGFTGAHLESLLLKKGFEVYGTVFKKSENKNHYSCDILNEEALFDLIESIKPDYIFHLAAISFVESENKQQIYNVNVFGTLNLLQAVNRLNYIPSKILVASSAAVYGNVEGELSEDMCPQPINHYGNSKLVMENMVKAYFTNQNIIITRPFNYTGVGQEQHFLIPKIVSHFKEVKKDIALGNIDVYREFNDVNFVVECYFNFMLSDFKSDIVNVCSGKTLNIKEIIYMMEKIANYKISIKVNEKFIRKNEIKVLKGSNKKMTSIIGDFLSKNEIRKTLERMYID